MSQSLQVEVLSILTDPIPSTTEYYLEKIKNFIRPLLRKIDGKQPLKKNKYGGHPAVTRSLIEGLQKAGIPFVYNPGRLKDCTGRVLVLSGVRTLRQALELKAAGKIRVLAAGPNLVVLPSDAPELVGSPLIDKFILNSNWIKDVYCVEMPRLANYSIIWPAGIDEIFWKPETGVVKRNKILFYLKMENTALYENCKLIAQKNGLELSELIYGNYNIDEYKKLLGECRYLVHFGEHESQGISMLEAWAMDVPSLVWNPVTYTLNGITPSNAAAPYLGNKTGAFFKNGAEFENCLKQLAANDISFTPRQWVLENMTDTILAKALVNQLEE